MSQASKIILCFLVFLCAITVAHGVLNLAWLEEKRAQLSVAHLPVT